MDAHKPWRKPPKTKTERDPRISCYVKPELLERVHAICTDRKMTLRDFVEWSLEQACGFLERRG